MRAIPISPAEAIFEPLWDPGAVQLERRFSWRILKTAQGKVFQNWASLMVSIDESVPDAPAAEIDRECSIEIEHYDTFRVQCRMPVWVAIAVDAKVDGSWMRVVEPTNGTDVTEEVDGGISGRVIEKYRISIILRENRPTVVALWWLGLANGRAECALATKTSPYDATWEDRLVPAASQDAPSIGLLFGAEKLVAIRQKVSDGPLKPVMELLRAKAVEAMNIDPESQIGRFVPFPWHMSPKKNRVGQIAFHLEMRILAFVGLVDRNAEYSRMAARMALSAAHCETWTDNITGLMPGIPWHCRSFVEEVYCQGCALALDWAGEFFTTYGAQIVRDAIVMKGLPRIESDFKRIEYIRSMNQGIVFSAGRVLGAMALLPEYPRYRTLIEEAEKDLFEMIDAYVLPDGGTLEGPSYWNYTFSNALPTMWALSRYRNTSFADYVPESVKKTGTYGLSMMSSEARGLWYLPVNDAHASQHYAPSLAAAYCRITDDTRWKSLYSALLEESPGPDYYHLILDPGPVEATVGTVIPRYDFLPETGQLDLVRLSEERGPVQFHFCGGPTYGGHFDEDKGAFILEAAGEVLAMDRGCCDYAHPESLLIGNADRHNLLIPEKDGEAFRQPPGEAYRAPMKAYHDDDVLAASVNLRDAWPEGLFVRNHRRICSPAPEIYWVEDEVQLPDPREMDFLLHTSFAIHIEDRAAYVQAKNSRLWIVPVNWKPTVCCRELGTDSHLHPVQVLTMSAQAAAEHRLQTIMVLAGPATDHPVAIEDSTIVTAGYSLQATDENGTRLSFSGPAGSGEIHFGDDGTVFRR